MNNYKVLVICETIFGEVEEEKRNCFKCNGEGIVYKQIKNWFFTGKENYEAYPEMPSCHLKFAEKQQIRVILIHRWTEDKSLNRLREEDEKKKFEILGFHTIETEKVNRIEKCDYSVIEELKKNELKKQLILLLHRIGHLFLPLDIDLQGISEVLKRNDETQGKKYYKEAFGNNGKGIVQNKIDEAKNLIRKLPDDRRNNISQLFEDNELERVKNSLENWEETKKLLREENPFHSWFCKLMKCLKNLGEE